MTRRLFPHVYPTIPMHRSRETHHCRVPPRRVYLDRITVTNLGLEPFCAVGSNSPTLGRFTAQRPKLVHTRTVVARQVPDVFLSLNP